ncbi:unnamed protein product [Chrysoparadoxa australica]
MLDGPERSPAPPREVQEAPVLSDTLGEELRRAPNYHENDLPGRRLNPIPTGCQSTSTRAKTAGLAGRRATNTLPFQDQTVLTPRTVYPGYASHDFPTVTYMVNNSLMGWKITTRGRKRAMESAFSDLRFEDHKPIPVYGLCYDDELSYQQQLATREVEKHNRLRLEKRANRASALALKRLAGHKGGADFAKTMLDNAIQKSRTIQMVGQSHKTAANPKAPRRQNSSPEPHDTSYARIVEQRAAAVARVCTQPQPPSCHQLSNLLPHLFDILPITCFVPMHRRKGRSRGREGKGLSPHSPPRKVPYKPLRGVNSPTCKVLVVVSASALEECACTTSCLLRAMRPTYAF